MRKLVKTNSTKDYFQSLCKIKSPNHFMKCNCHKQLYNNLYKSMMKIELQEHKKLKLSQDLINMRLEDFSYKVYKKMFQLINDEQFVKKNPKQFSNFCYDEYNQIVNTYKRFVDKYDLMDPRAFSIVKALINNQLTVIRMQKESDFEGVTIKSVDKLGNKVLSLNPVEETKRRYNDSIIHAIEVLDKIFEGSKIVSVNFRDEMIKAYSKDISSTDDNSTLIKDN